MTATNVFSRQRIILFFIFTLVASGTAEYGDYCGSITTADGHDLQLLEDVTLTPEEFDLVHIGKMANALVKIDIRRFCIIQICGFTSLKPKTNPDYMGSLMDFRSCFDFVRPEKFAPPLPFNKIYNASSVACSCTVRGHSQTEKRDPRETQCSTQCNYDEKYQNFTWGVHQCAVLYQRKFCMDCKFNPVALHLGETVKTNLSTTFRSAHIRDGCSVIHEIPASVKYWNMRDWDFPIVYPSTRDPIALLQSAYDSEPEFFSCTCEGSSITTSLTISTSAPVPTSTSTPPCPDIDAWYAQFIVIGGVILALVAIVLMRTWRANKKL